MRNRVFRIAQKLFIAGAVILIGVSIFLFFQYTKSFWLNRDLPIGVVIDAEEYVVDIADTERERALGLGGRTMLCTTCAMLFLFDTEAKHGFWMAGMRFPLDIIWLRGDVVVHIERHVSQESRETYFPPSVADKVLEGNAGSFDALDVGDTVKFLYPKT